MTINEGWLYIGQDANTVSSGQITISSGTISSGYVSTQPLSRCIQHLAGEWSEEPGGAVVVSCQICGEQMTVTLPDGLGWVGPLKGLLTSVIVGDINDELRAIVKARREALDLANEQMALLQLLLQ